MTIKLNMDIPLNIRGIVYICEFDYDNTTIKVIREILFPTSFEAMMAYANIPNPESQLVAAETSADLRQSIKTLEKNMNNKKWLENLKNCL